MNTIIYSPKHESMPKATFDVLLSGSELYDVLPLVKDYNLQQDNNASGARAELVDAFLAKIDDPDAHEFVITSDEARHVHESCAKTAAEYLSGSIRVEPGEEEAYRHKRALALTQRWNWKTIINQGEGLADGLPEDKFVLESFRKLKIEIRHPLRRPSDFDARIVLGRVAKRGAVASSPTLQS